MKDSTVVYDPKYFSGPCGVYYYAPLDKIFWLKKSEELQFFNTRTKKLHRKVVYDYETELLKYKKVLVKKTASNHFIRLDIP